MALPNSQPVPPQVELPAGPSPAVAVTGSPPDSVPACSKNLTRASRPSQVSDNRRNTLLFSITFRILNIFSPFPKMCLFVMYACKFFPGHWLPELMT